MNQQIKAMATSLLISAFLLGLFSAVSSNVNAVIINGDWIIFGEEVRENETIILIGNLIINNGGNLTLKNTTLKINSVQDWQFGIVVNGSFYIKNSKITAFNSGYKFKFLVNSGAIFEMSNSELSECVGLTIKTENATIKNNKIYNNYLGIIFENSSNNQITNNSVYNNNYGIYLYSSNNNIENSTITNNTAYDLYLHSNSKNNAAINTTFLKVYISPNSKLIVKNYLEVLVIDKNSYPIENATVSVKDNEKEVFNGKTNSQGLSSLILITNKIYNSNNTTENETIIYISKNGFTFNDNPREVNISSYREIFIANEEQLAELTLNASDISFSNNNPIEEEVITIFAKIWNRGDIEAEDVSVKFYNFNALIGEFVIDKIEKNNSKTAFINWIAEKGNSSIQIKIDELDKIREGNENNNFAKKQIYVSEKLSLKISIILEPKEKRVDVKDKDGIAVFNGEVSVYNIYNETTIELVAFTNQEWNPIIDIKERQLLPKYGINQKFSFNATVIVPKETFANEDGRLTIIAYRTVNGKDVGKVVVNSTIKINPYYKFKVEKIGGYNYTFTEIDQKKNYSFKITNLGNEDDYFSIDIPNLREVYEKGWNIILSKVLISLEPNEGSTFTLTLYPIENTPKDITVILKVSSEKAEERGVLIYSETTFNASYEKTQAIIIATPNYGVYIVSALMLTVIILSFFAGTEIGRVKILMLFSALMIRIRRDDALDNFLRGRLYEYIKTNPGASFTDMLKSFEIGNGTLAYHLLILERTEYIKSQNDGLYKRYYPTEMKIKAKDIKFLTEIQKAILEKIKTNHGISQSKIAKELGKSKRVVNYHVNLLKDAEIVRVERVGFQTKCYLAEK